MNRVCTVNLSVIPYCLNDYLATIIFCQSWHYFFRIKNGKPFFKFISPSPKHPLYRKGDSWTEELHCTHRQFSYSLSKISSPKNPMLVIIPSQKPSNPHSFAVNLPFIKKLEILELISQRSIVA